MKNKISAIVLAAGKGSRMNSEIPKQYMNILGKPVLYYSLAAFQQSDVDNVVLVVGENEIKFCTNEIIEKYHFTKVRKIVIGGKERYSSVYNGLESIGETDYVLIHDGARPMITSELINYTISMVKEYPACVLGVPTKDTIKIVDSNHMVTGTPDRRIVYNIQTPQAFSYNLIKNAYSKLVKRNDIAVTDDAMVIEVCTDVSIKIIEGSYHNIKITTNEDIEIAELFLDKYSS